MHNLAHLVALVSLASLAQALPGPNLSGVVRDISGAPIVSAEVVLLNAERDVSHSAWTNATGQFSFDNIRPGSFLLQVRVPGFALHRESVFIAAATSDDLVVVLAPSRLEGEVSVTAQAGIVDDVHHSGRQVNVIDERDIHLRAKSVIAQIASDEVGVGLQRTSSSVAGVFVRGLGGNKVNVYLDGVRYTHSAARGGINTFLDLIGPAGVEGVEILRGPSSSRYGSGAIGGSVQFLSRIPSLSHGTEVHGRLGTFFNSSDMSFGSELTASLGTRRVGLSATISGRRVNTLRTGKGIDSHAAVTRYLGLRSDALAGPRLPDTAFTQYGGNLHLRWALAPTSQIVLHYRRSQQDGGKRYDQLLGGDGNLVADLRNLMLDLCYLKWTRFGWGWFDEFRGVYSFNTQREERVNQGGGGNPLWTIHHNHERIQAHGVQASVQKTWGRFQTLVAGIDFYHERMLAPASSRDPVTRRVSPRRPRIPDNAVYRSGGAYVHQVLEIVPAKVRLVGNLRYGLASYRARSEDAPVVDGSPLWPSDSLTASDLTFRGGVVWMPGRGWSASVHLSRGFRAPQMTDLGALGLTGSGFEVAASALSGSGATVGSTSGAEAANTGIPVRQVQPETSWSFEGGLSYRNSRLDLDFVSFLNDVRDNVDKQTLILPPGAVGRELGGEPIIAQLPSGAVFVAPSPNPVLVRVNFGDLRLWGVEQTLRLKLPARLVLSAQLTSIQAKDQRSGGPPNRAVPPVQGSLRLRYTAASARFWLEPVVRAAGRQDDLSSLALEDRRLGASRSRFSIEQFYFNGATVRGLVGPGRDGQLATPDDVLIPTGETLRQVQDRVLGPGVANGPLFRSIAGYVTFGLRGGFLIRGQDEVLFELENLADRNYRGISWGLDAPGRGIYFRYNHYF